MQRRIDFLMDYPKEILPKKGFVVPFPFHELSKAFGDFLLCYRIDGSVEENLEPNTFNGQRKLKTACFAHLPHLSMNLYGGLFQPWHVRFIQKKSAGDRWGGEFDVSLEEHIEHVMENERYVPIFYQASELCQNIKTIVSFQNKSAYDAASKLFSESGYSFPPYEKDKFLVIDTEIRVEHVPTNLNYWHTQMEVYPPHGEKELRDDSATWRKRIFTQIRNSILCYHYAETPQIDYQIPEHLYSSSQ